MIKDTVEQLNRRDTQGEVHVGRSPELLCPLQVCQSPSTSTCSPTWKLSEPHTLGIYGGFITHS